MKNNFEKGIMMAEQKNNTELSMEKIITSAVKIRGVKVNRGEFLTEIFISESDKIQDILDFGPVEAQVPQEKLAELANKLILKRTSQSSVASFAAGIPGGLAMAATVPADVLQFFGMSLRLAQELSYLYGAQDLWQDGQVDDDKVKNQLLLYCGVMFGVSGAVSGVRVLSAQIAKTTLKKLPQKALTKTFWYPIIKQIGKAIGIKVTKTTVAQGFSKAIPVIGGVISGSLNFASMMPMANRLQKTLDSAAFGYTEEDLEKDIIEIEKITDENTIEEPDVKMKFVDSGKKVINNFSGLFAKKKTDESLRDNDVFESLKKLSELKEMGVLSEEEFSRKKADLIAKI